jgi:hypothetical protein
VTYGYASRRNSSNAVNVFEDGMSKSPRHFSIFDGPNMAAERNYEVR